MDKTPNSFSSQRKIRKPWRQYLDSLIPLRPELHGYCRKLTGNVWDAEDLVQDTLIRVFSQLGKTDGKLANPRSYLIRTATNLWIDHTRRRLHEYAILELEKQELEDKIEDPSRRLEISDAASWLLQHLHPQERAAVVLKDTLDLSLEETASILRTTVGSVKSALSRGRGRLDRSKPVANFSAPDKAIVESFMQALESQDIRKLESICSSDLRIELVGGAEFTSFEEGRSFFKHAHMEMPAIGFGMNPNWKLLEFESETLIVGFRSLRGAEGVNEVHRIETLDGVIVRVRCYCFCPDSLKVIADHLKTKVVNRKLAYRSPTLWDIPGLLIHNLRK